MMTIYVDYNNGKTSRHANITAIHYISNVEGFFQLDTTNPKVTKYLNKSHITQMTVEHNDVTT